jgi:hypothetical protein
MLTTMPTASGSMPGGAWRPMKRTRVPTFKSIFVCGRADDRRVATDQSEVRSVCRWTRLLCAVLDTGSAVEMLTAKTFVSNECCQSLAVPERPPPFRGLGNAWRRPRLAPRYGRGLPLCKEKPRRSRDGADRWGRNTIVVRGRGGGAIEGTASLPYRGRR